MRQELAKEHNCTSNPSSAHGSQQHELPLRPSLDLRCRGRVRVRWLGLSTCYPDSQGATKSTRNRGPTQRAQEGTDVTRVGRG